MCVCVVFRSLRSIDPDQREGSQKKGRNATRGVGGISLVLHFARLESELLTMKFLGSAVPTRIIAVPAARRKLEQDLNLLPGKWATKRIINQSVIHGQFGNFESKQTVTWRTWMTSPVDQGIIADPEISFKKKGWPIRKLRAPFLFRTTQKQPSRPHSSRTGRRRKLP